MFDDALPIAARNPGVLTAMYDAVARLPRLARRRDRRRAVDRHVALPRVEAPGAWMSPPPERPLPRDLNLPLSAFDPSALRRAAIQPIAASAAAFVDPIILERTLHRIHARC
jgi:hypothetical protein